MLGDTMTCTELEVVCVMHDNGKVVLSGIDALTALSDAVDIKTRLQNSGQWLETCQAAAGPGRAGPGGLRARLGGQVATDAEPRGAGNSAERHDPQRRVTCVFEFVQ